MFKQTVIIVWLLCLTAVSARADFEEGMKAFQGGFYDVALKEWLPLATDGDVGAQIGLGMLFAAGKGVIADDFESEKWFRMAAEQGSALAQLNLGSIYRNCW